MNDVPGENFAGLAGRQCREHRTVGPHRAWCFDCSEWCYPQEPCRGCDPRIYTQAHLDAAVSNARGAQPCVPDGMTPEKLEQIADYVSALDRMTIDLEKQTVRFGPARTGETEMQDDLRAWAEALRGQDGGSDGQA